MIVFLEHCTLAIMRKNSSCNVIIPILVFISGLYHIAPKAKLIFIASCIEILISVS